MKKEEKKEKKEKKEKEKKCNSEFSCFKKSIIKCTFSSLLLLMGLAYS